MNRRSMGLLSRFQKKSNPAPDGDPAKVGNVVWRKGDFISVPMGSDMQVIYPRHGTPVPLPSFTLEFVANCLDVFPKSLRVLPASNIPKQSVFTDRF